MNLRSACTGKIWKRHDLGTPQKVVLQGDYGKYWDFEATCKKCGRKIYPSFLAVSGRM